MTRKKIYEDVLWLSALTLTAKFSEHILRWSRSREVIYLYFRFQRNNPSFSLFWIYYLIRKPKIIDTLYFLKFVCPIQHSDLIVWPTTSFTASTLLSSFCLCFANQVSHGNESSNVMWLSGKAIEWNRVQTYLFTNCICYIYIYI